MRKETKAVALGGMLGAVAMVIMLLGGLIPVSTYICPVMCMLILQTALNLCGKKIAWAWYIMVALLSLLLGPDKEAAALLVLMGYYPITPSTQIAENLDIMRANGETDLVMVAAEGEHSAAGNRWSTAPPHNTARPPAHKPENGAHAYPG